MIQRLEISTMPFGFSAVLWIPEAWTVFVFHGVTYRRDEAGFFHADA